MQRHGESLLKRKEIGNKINVSLAQEFLKDPAGEYLDFLKTLRNDVAQKGLTQDELDEILKDKYAVLCH